MYRNTLNSLLDIVNYSDWMSKSLSSPCAYPRARLASPVSCNSRSSLCRQVNKIKM